MAASGTRIDCDMPDNMTNRTADKEVSRPLFPQVYCATCVDKLERMGWTDRFVVDALGLYIAVRVNDAEAMRRAETLFAEFGWPLIDNNPIPDLILSIRIGQESSRQGVKNYHLLYAGSLMLARTLKVEELWETLRGTLLSYVIGSNPEYVFLNSPAVTYKGKTILLPGQKERGALVTSLVDQGAELYSEQYVLVSNEGMVAPYPRAWEFRTAEVVAFLEIRGRVKGLRPRTLIPGESGLRLVACAVNTKVNPVLALSGIASLANQAYSVYSRYSCDGTAARDLLTLSTAEL